MPGWHNLTTLSARKYLCGFCDQRVATERGYFTDQLPKTYVYICPNCHLPTLFTPDIQSPGPATGAAVAHVPKEINALYEEARRAVAARAPTAAVLACRKLLMHIAVEQKAPENASFLAYVEYLAEKGYVPPNGKGWVDHIRKKGNEANHEIVLMSVEDATELITFSEMLLKFIYEFPQRVSALPAKQ